MSIVASRTSESKEEIFPVEALWYTRCPVPTASGIALDLGWLGDEFGRSGIALKSILDSDDPKIQISHFSHTLPGLFREGGNIPAIWARSAGSTDDLIYLMPHRRQADPQRLQRLGR